MNKRILSILSGVAGLVLSGVIYFVVKGIPADVAAKLPAALQMYCPAGFPERAMEAARYVIFLAVVMAILCAILIVTSAKNNDTEKPVWVKAPFYFTATSVLTILYAASMEYIGFYVSSVLYMLALALALGLRRPWLLIISTVVLIAVVYGVFVSFLGVPVPLGIFEDFDFKNIPASIQAAKIAWAAL